LENSAINWRELSAQNRNSESPDFSALNTFAKEIRLKILDTIYNAGMGHIGGDFSVSDILATLYFSVLDIDPNNPNKINRDRLILSKGHASVSLYTCLSLVGFFDSKLLSSFGQNLSVLNGHPNKNKVSGVEANTGPLGHGLPISAGIALGYKFQNINNRVFVITGDGELQEGSNWEAIMFAAHRKLNNLTLIIDNNNLQQGSSVKEINNSGNFVNKLKSFNWDVFEIDGHDKKSLYEVLIKKTELPKAVIANTIKGYGVSFMENDKVWHHKVPNQEQYLKAKSEIQKS